MNKFQFDYTDPNFDNKMNELKKYSAKFNGSDDLAADRAVTYYEEGSELEDAVRQACNEINIGNAEPEYENEDFFEEETDYHRVLEYLKKKVELFGI